MTQVQPLPIMEFPMHQTQESSSQYSGDYMQVSYFTGSKGIVENILLGVHNPGKGDSIRAYVPVEVVKYIVEHAETINKQIEADKQKNQKQQTQKK